VLHVTTLGPTHAGQSQCGYVCEPPAAAAGH
jgi:hypothetical protein